MNWSPCALALTLMAPSTVHAQDDNYAMAQGTTLTANGQSGNPPGVLANDGAVGGPAALVTPPPVGTLTLHPDGTFVFVPGPNAIGTVAFTYSTPVPIADGTSTWRYLNPLDGVNPATTTPNFDSEWGTVGFDDSGWGTGTGLMGYGSISDQNVPITLPLTTNISTPVNGQRRTAFFRRSFQSPGAFTGSLRIRLLRDDAAIIYLNGTELGRSRQPAAVDFAAGTASWNLMVDDDPDAWTNDGDEEVTVHEHVFDNLSLPAGENVLAVSVHNSAPPTSSDLALRVDLAEFTIAPVHRVASIAISDGNQPPVAVFDSYVVPPGLVLDTAAAGFPSPFTNDGLGPPGGNYFDPLTAPPLIGGPAATRPNFSFDPATGHFHYVRPASFFGIDYFTIRLTDKDGVSNPGPVYLHLGNGPVDPPWKPIGIRGGGVTAVLGQSLTLGLEGLATFPVPLGVGEFFSIEASPALPATDLAISVRDPAGAIVHQSVLDDGRFVATTDPAPIAGVWTISIANASLDQVHSLTLSVVVNASALPANPVAGVPPPFQRYPDSHVYRPYSILATESAASSPAQELTWRVLMPPDAVAAHFGWEGATGSGLPAHLIIEDAATGLRLLNESPLGGSRVHALLGDTAPLTPLGGRELIVRVGGRPPGEPLLGVATFAVNGGLGNEPAPPASQLESDDFTVFHGQIESADQTDPAHITFAVIGDFGVGAGPALDVASMIDGWDPNFIVTLGDNNYSDIDVGSPAWESVIGTPYGRFILGRTDNLYPLQTSLTQRFFPSVGNHDCVGSGVVAPGPCPGLIDYLLTDGPGGAERLPITASNGRGDPNALYYHFVRGPCHFFVLDSNHALANPDVMIETQAWLAAALGESTARWQIVCFHHNSYGSSGPYGTNPAMTWIADLPEVDVLLQAHAHIYERIWINNKLILSVGISGRALYSLAPDPLPETLFRSNDEFGAVRATASDSHLAFECFRLPEAGETTEQLHDSHVLGTDPGLDTDEYAISIPPAAQLRGTVRCRAHGTGGSFRPRIELIDESGSVVASAASVGDAPAVVVWPNTTSSTDFRLRVSSADGRSGDYSVEYAIENAPGFAAWAASIFGISNFPVAQAALDHDLDSIPTLVEYANGTDPRDGLESIGPRLSATPANAAIEITVAAPARPDLICHLEESIMLGAWTSVASRVGAGDWTSEFVVEADPSPPPGQQIFRFRPDDDPPAPQRRFYRLRCVLDGN